ncbi:hypothetical protein OZ411_03710 [Bradyrhizobium sp. Arg237L]|uniref:hypothetical protein n=1 Tax=Bradyrhizobium sp. Arg237L TaxID=3003352 RepID=UPI00249E3FD6|nr:hypothetical protein [Bradyrhizobium sp. Arg237L]MDI4231918.1 hypothetical protein [Bradyrhizobium sp. Arg237L]
MMKPMPMLMTVTIVALMLVAIPAYSAEMVRDEATGLTVTPPHGYVVERETPSIVIHAGARFSLRKPLDPPSTGCTVEAQLLPPIDETSAALGRALSARSREGTTTWRDKALLQIMSEVAVRSSRPYSRDGIEALEVEGWPRQGADAAGSRIDRSTRMRIVVLKLGNGYTNVTCRAAVADFPGKRDEFDAVVHGVKLSR